MWYIYSLCLSPSTKWDCKLPAKRKIQFTSIMALYIYVCVCVCVLYRDVSSENYWRRLALFWYSGDPIHYWKRIKFLGHYLKTFCSIAIKYYVWLYCELPIFISFQLMLPWFRPFGGEQMTKILELVVLEKHRKIIIPSLWNFAI